MDIATIGALFSTLKSASELANGVLGARDAAKDADHQYQLAALKAKIAEAMSQAADIKMTMIALQEELATTREQVKRAASMSFDIAYYWDISTDPRSGPYCPTCWDVQKLAVRLQKTGHTWICLNCRGQFGTPEERAAAADDSARRLASARQRMNPRI